jgi:hypothetical protein
VHAVAEAEEDMPSHEKGAGLTVLEADAVGDEVFANVLVKVLGTTLAITFLSAHSPAKLSSAHNPFSALGAFILT